MNKHERAVAIGLFILLLVSWLGFLVHRSPRFAGSLPGGMLGVAGAVFLVIPLLYSFIKRIPALRRAVGRKSSLGTILSLHIYFGLLGSIFGILHTGHKCSSLLGITLVSCMFLVVFSGVVVRYFLKYVTDSLQEKRSLLFQLEQRYRSLSEELRSKEDVRTALLPFASFFGRLVGSLAYASHGNSSLLPQQVVFVSDAIADVEYSIKTHVLFQRSYKVWLIIHIAVSLVFYGLLAAHIVGEAYYGLRWFE